MRRKNWGSIELGAAFLARPAFLRYAAPIALIGLAMLVRALLESTQARHYPLVPSFVAIMLIAWYGGIGPTILGLLLGSIALFSSSSARPDSAIVGIGLFWFVGLIPAFISHSQRRATARTEAVLREVEERREQLQRESAERRRADEALRENEIRARSVLHTAVDGFIVIDSQGIIESFNPAAERLFGYSRAEVLGQNVKMLMPSPYREEHDGYVNRYLQTGERRVIGIGREVLARRKDGVVFPIELGVGEMWLGTRRMFTGVIHDITERKRAEDDLRLAKEAAEAAYRQVEAAGRMKDEFLATLSHELRTPLNAILGWSRLLRSSSSDPAEIAQAVEVIERNAMAQAQLIEDLLDVSRIISGKIHLNIKALDFKDIVLAAIDSVTPAALARDIRLEPHFEEEHARVTGDATRLQQVVWNLLSNAIKFTPRHGRVTVQLAREESLLSFRITDTGKGMSPEFLPHVFERFRQAEGGSTRRYGGLGLGLAIVRHLVELHGGTVAVQSPGEGKGTTFTVHLPFMAVHQDDSLSAPTSSTDRVTSQITASLTGIKILAVDDQPDAGRLVCVTLERHKSHVRTATNAREALAILADFHPDLLIADIGMPGEDGYWLIRQVRALPPDQGGQIPAIALTAFAREQDHAAALAAGFQRHIAKPVDPAHLASVVASLARPPAAV